MNIKKTLVIAGATGTVMGMALTGSAFAGYDGNNYEYDYYGNNYSNYPPYNRYEMNMDNYQNYSYSNNYNNRRMYYSYNYNKNDNYGRNHQNYYSNCQHNY